MKKVLSFVALFLCGSAQVPAQSPSARNIVGRWNITIEGPRGAYPSWLEITRNGEQYAGRFVGRVGSARELSRVQFVDNKLTFSLPPQYERQKSDLVFVGSVTTEGLAGLTETPDGTPVNWSAVRAPKLQAPKGEPRWSDPITLFNGMDLTKWRLRNDLGSCWSVEDGAMTNAPPCADIVTVQKFADFKLHAEFKLAAESNSGVYLRGRYEVQLLADFGKPPDVHGMGAIYGFLVPAVNAGRPPNEWQTMDVTLLGRSVTVVLNGKTIISNQEIPGITGGALDSDEAASGPVMLQGDHGKISFRNIVLTPTLP